MIKAIIYMLNISTGKHQASIVQGSEYVRQCGWSLIYIKNRRGPKIFPGEHHILDISELTYKNLDDKSVFDYLNTKQTIEASPTNPTVL